MFFSLLTNDFTLPKVHNNISLHIDTGKVTTLTILDLSAAFGTIDYSVLLDHLSDWYDISGTALTLGSTHS